VKCIQKVRDAYPLRASDAERKLFFVRPRNASLAGGEEASKRYADIKAAFEERFDGPPELYARAPGEACASVVSHCPGQCFLHKYSYVSRGSLYLGRVNLIGEHIDYEGYGVLPMAIKQVEWLKQRFVPFIEGSELALTELLNRGLDSGHCCGDPKVWR
jgi:Galactokinase galactose-binding signature